MQKRPFGNTGIDVSILGAGGFHLLEISQGDVTAILNRYLDAGGNYIETAAAYGDGASEKKIGAAIRHRRDEYLLATKTTGREKADALAQLERSLRLLGTDHVDVWFLHNIPDIASAERVLAPGGAVEAIEEAKRLGMVRFGGITGHGQPVGLLHALERYPFDAMMTQVNYYDDCSFPAIRRKLIPLAQSRGTAMIAMKALGDGYLWRSPEAALRYAWSQPVALAVAGMNTQGMLDADLAAAEQFAPMTAADLYQLFHRAPEFRGYACRQCQQCRVKTALPLPRIFELEGWYDRQMWDYRMQDADSADFALRMRLAGWFGNAQLAREAFAAEGIAIDPEADYSELNGQCEYGLDVNRKLKIAYAKLTGTEPRI
jgi:predicted aldo/keto reductase-like oxidoreductase